jgi:hypothetical protein
MEISATQLGAEAIKNTLNKVKLPPSAVEDVMMGLVHLRSLHTFFLKNKYKLLLPPLPNKIIFSLN